MKHWLIPVAAAFTLAVAAVHAQDPATPAAAGSSAPQVSGAAPVSAPNAASTPALPPAPKAKQAATSGKGDKSCIAAGRKLDRERNSLAYAKDETARYVKASQSCATKSTCARYKAALDSLEKRVARHERRIETFTANRDKACKA